MTILPLAVGIADTILNAAGSNRRFNLVEVANELLRQHPAVDVSTDDVVSTLREEGRLAGLCLETC
ncbi:hypothetical protein JYU29_09120 [Tianweitania sp. BSSL-BM11]|uniref:Uncharacterized protein n=1 Tax=Tianweitania aestuarii TaxID=2814886 RepID=A0ABS5RVP6_9HYPH|nr:hypothetical protein [Tianweitania aestuarii]MBS9720845.1 hypothetical protein [Tianweitania aestuarii]